MKLGTAVWTEGAAERTALVAELPGHPDRVVDLNRLEQVRLAKLGEGRPEALADAQVPAGLRLLLEAGPRGIHRARQTVAYAEKWWRRRGDLPEELAPRIQAVRMLACLPRPLALRRWDGSALDRLAVAGPGATVGSLPVPTLALAGLHGGQPAGCCLALEHARGVVLGAWLELDLDWTGALDWRLGGQCRHLPLEAWQGLSLSALRAGEVVLAPPPRLRMGSGQPGQEVILAGAFERLVVRLGDGGVHPTVQ